MQFKQRENNSLQCLLRGCSVFFHDIVSQVQSQEGTKERHRKTEIIILTGPRETVNMPYKRTTLWGTQGMGSTNQVGEMR